MRILLPFLREIPEHGFYQAFYQGVMEALREMGHEPIAFFFAKFDEKTQEEAQALHRQLSINRINAVLDLCCWGSGLSQFALVKRDGEQEPIFGVFDVPYVGMLFDHPYNQAINGIRARRLYATYPDLGHPEQVRLVFPDLRLRGEIFAPPAIRPGDDRSAVKWLDRDIDVLYVGNLWREALERFWRNPANGFWLGSHNPEVCDAIADAALAEPDRSLHLSVQAAIARIGTLPPGFDFNPQLRAVEGFLRATYRRDAVVSLARSGVRMRVVGRGWEALDLPANVERGAEIDYEGFFRSAGQAKICLDASTYLDGANDRVFSYALNGSVCFTNAAGYLRGTFGGDGGMRFYSMQRLGELAEGVRELLARPAELRAAGERARESVLASHTWRHRLDGILAAVRG
jgi:hypothetical protein